MPDENLQSELVEPLRSALAAVRRTTGILVSLGTSYASEQDGKIRFKFADGQEIELVYEVKTPIDRRAQLSVFKEQHGAALLITRSLSLKMAEECRSLEIQFLDSSGNCFIKQPGIFVYVTGLKDSTAAPSAAIRGLTPASLRVMFAILAKPSILEGTVREIADIAAISHGAAGIALVMLEELDLIGKATTGRRMMFEPGRWLDMWTEGYLGRLRPKLETYRMHSLTPLSTILQQVTPAMHEIILGGEAAAAHAELGLKPGALTLYVDLQPRVMGHLARQFKLRKDPHGEIELLQIFWNTHELPSFPTVPDALIYADLVGSGDARSMETAAVLRKRIVEHVASKTR